MSARIEWLECGQGTVLHPVTGRALKTEVVELAGFGRIFEILDYSNEPAANLRLILAGPELLEALERLVDECGNAGRAGRDAACVEARAAIAKAKEVQS